MSPRLSYFLLPACPIPRRGGEKRDKLSRYSPGSFPVVRKCSWDFPGGFPVARKWAWDSPGGFPVVRKWLRDFPGGFPAIRKWVWDLPEGFPVVRKGGWDLPGSFPVGRKGVLFFPGPTAPERVERIARRRFRKTLTLAGQDRESRRNPTQPNLLP